MHLFVHRQTIDTCTDPSIEMCTDMRVDMRNGMHRGVEGLRVLQILWLTYTRRLRGRSTRPGKNIVYRHVYTHACTYVSAHVCARVTHMFSARVTHMSIIQVYTHVCTHD